MPNCSVPNCLFLSSWCQIVLPPYDNDDESDEADKGEEDDKDDEDDSDSDDDKDDDLSDDDDEDDNDCGKSRAGAENKTSECF